MAVCVSTLSCLKSLLVSYINGDFAGLQLRYEFGRTKQYAAWINILIFYVSGFFLSKISEKKTVKRDWKFLVSPFISNVNLMNKIHRFYFINVCLGGLKFLNPTLLTLYFTMSKNDQTHFKNLTAFAARFLNVWPFYNIAK